MVTHYGDDSFSLIDAGSGAIVQTVVDVDEPFAVAMSNESAGRAYVSSASAAYDSVLAFDIDANRVVADVPAGLRRQRPGRQPGRAARLRRPHRCRRRRCRDPRHRER